MYVFEKKKVPSQNWYDEKKNVESNQIKKKFFWIKMLQDRENL